LRLRGSSHRLIVKGKGRCGKTAELNGTRVEHTISDNSNFFGSLLEVARAEGEEPHGGIELTLCGQLLGVFPIKHSERRRANWSSREEMSVKKEIKGKKGFGSHLGG